MLDILKRSSVIVIGLVVVPLFIWVLYRSYLEVWCMMYGLIY